MVVSAFDISKKALKLAKVNAIKNDVSIYFEYFDMRKPLRDNYDIIISNPPYIGKNTYISPSVKKYEPHLALYAKDKGIYFYKKIIDNDFSKLNKPGLMAFEIGDQEKSLIEDYIKLKYPNMNYSFEKDLTGKTRYLFIFNE